MSAYDVYDPSAVALFSHLERLNHRNVMIASPTQEMVMTSTNFDTKDKKPLHERKSDDRGRQAVEQRPSALDERGRGDANAIGSPDLFLQDRHRELRGGNIRIHQVKADSGSFAYVITEGSKIGYFELDEGMPRAEAEAALNGAYDGTAVVL